MTLTPQLRSLVKQSVALLGAVITRELGLEAYLRIERTRQAMRAIRGAKGPRVTSTLRRSMEMLDRLSPTERRDFAKAFTLMLELMNSCENAYRSHRLQARGARTGSRAPDSIIYVLTAHPTEARAPTNIAAFHEIQKVLFEILSLAADGGEARFTAWQSKRLLHWIEMAWRTPIVRSRKPRVSDEAEHIYSTVLRDETLETLLRASREICPVLIRSWVGGDKDGHPGVDEKTFVESISLSRLALLRFARSRFRRLSSTLEDLRDPVLLRLTRDAEGELASLTGIRAGDARRVTRFRKKLRALIRAYLRTVSVLHPALDDLLQLVRTFPALVVPLEFREASDVIMAGGKNIAIRRMLRKLGQISRGGQPRWYCRGLVISMAESLEHVTEAARMIRAELGAISLPVVPLFEQAEALRGAPDVVRGMIHDPALRRARKEHWEGYLEVMVGYSDSAKESGVLPSRRLIGEVMQKLDRLCRREKVTPLFFHGSGGSVDRGGGSIQEQTAWWPASSLRNYKVTVQGEMVERSFATPQITRGQLDRIAAVSAHPGRRAEPAAVRVLADQVSENYRARVHDPEFLRVVEQATPYRVLDALKIGSRPTKRSKQLSVAGLRAIPWVLCWTQTRVLFPTWWGIGSAWKGTGAAGRAILRNAYRTDPLFATYVRSLAFTLAKVELPVWGMYLEAAGLSPRERARVVREFGREYELALKFTREVMGSRNILGWRPWLQESIHLRSPMIHPLNLLQVIALREKDFELLRLTVTGIASGMLTTG